MNDLSYLLFTSQIENGFSKGSHRSIYNKTNVKEKESMILLLYQWFQTSIRKDAAAKLSSFKGHLQLENQYV